MNRLNPRVSPLALDTPLGGNLAILSMTGFEGLSQLFLFDLEIVSARADIEPSELLEQSVSVQLSLTGDGANLRHFHGRAVRLRYLETRNDGLSRYQLTLRPFLWQLTLTANCRIFQGQAVPEIVFEVLRSHGFTDVESALVESYDAREYVVQYRETDFEFVSRLLAREGIYYFFRHEAERHIFVLADFPTAHEAGPGCDPLPYAVHDAHRDASIEYVHRFHADAQLSTGAYAHADYDFTKAGVELYANQNSPVESANSELRWYDHPGGFTTFAAGEASTRIRLEQARIGALSWSGASNARGLSAGSTFRLEEHPRSDQNRNYLLVSCRYRLSVPDVASNAGPDAPVFLATFRAIDARLTFRPPLSAPRLTARGPQTATVVGPAGREIFTDQYGRVKVHFHWDRTGTHDERSSCWIRVAQAWAGPHWGAQFVPRIGQEVIVDFLDGDPDRPVIMGNVYNSANMPPFELPQNQTQSGVRSRSTPKGNQNNGNEIRFEDLRGYEDLFIQAEKTQTTLIKGDQSVSIGGDRAMTVAGSESVSIGVDQSTEVAGASTTIIGGERSEAIGADSRSLVGGTRGDTISGGYALNVSGDWVARSGGITRLDVGGALRVAVIGDESHTTGGSLELRVGDKASQVFAAEFNTLVGHADREANRTAFIYGTESLHVTKELLIESDTSIVLKCGNTKVVITPEGVTVNGDALLFSAGSKLTASAQTSVLTLDGSVSAIGTEFTASSAGATLALTAEAKLIGAKVQLGAGGGANVSGAGPAKGPAEKNKPVYLRTKVLRKGKPVAGVPYKLLLDGELELSGSTTAQGLVEKQIPGTVATVQLTLLDLNEQHTFAIGPLDAIDSVLGVQQRLKRLGYYHGQLDGAAGPLFAHGVTAFQTAQGLSPSGETDAATRAAVQKAYGS